MGKHIQGIFLLLTLLAGVAASAQEAAYAPGKVVYDVATSDPGALKGILDRASLLQDHYNSDPFEASIVIVLHEGAIPPFSNRAPDAAPLRDRARGLALGGIIRFSLCRTSARMQGYGDHDFADFIAMVPMADAEIVRLQTTGYAYLR
jgi:intracellular sulfur oxidation DsrE/DsrF family protein